MKSVYAATTIIFFVLFSVSLTQANPFEQNWQSGQLTLSDSRVLRGELSYNWSAEMVMFRQEDGGVRTFSARQVQEFEWFDFDQSKQRQFISLTSPIDNERIGQAFYEVCLQGSLPVVRRLRRPHGLFKRAFSNPTHFIDSQTLTQNPDHFEYFAYDEGLFLALDRFYTDIYDPHLATYDRELKQYARNHNINERSLLGRLVLIDQYNHLAGHNQKSASARTTNNALK